jgi:hypothetical protein
MWATDLTNPHSLWSLVVPVFLLGLIVLAAVAFVRINSK